MGQRLAHRKKPTVTMDFSAVPDTRQPLGYPVSINLPLTNYPIAPTTPQNSGTATTPSAGRGALPSPASIAGGTEPD